MGKTYKMNAITGELDLVENLEEINAALEKGILKSVDVSGENMIFTFNTPDLAPVTVPLAHFATNLQGHAYIGLATPSTTPVNLKGNEKVFYIASEEGIYSNFGVGNISELSIIKSDNGSWKVEWLGVRFILNSLVSFNSTTTIPITSGADLSKNNRYLLSKPFGGKGRLTIKMPSTIARDVGVYLYDSDNKLIWQDTSFSKEESYDVELEKKACYFRLFSSKTATADGNISVVFNTVGVIESINTHIQDIDQYLEDSLKKTSIFNEDNMTSGKYIYTDGSVRSTTDTNYTATEYLFEIPKYITCSIMAYNARMGNNFPIVCFYDADKHLLSYVKEMGTPPPAEREIFIPEGAKYASFAYYKSSSFETSFAVKSTISLDGITSIGKKVDASDANTPMQFTAFSDKRDVNVGETLALPSNKVKKNTSLTAHIKGFGNKVSIGVGYSNNANYLYRTYDARWIEIDNEDVKLYAYYNETSQSPAVTSKPHNLTLTNEIYVSIISKMEDNEVVTDLNITTSKGDEYTERLQSWGQGSAFVTNNNTSGSMEVDLAFMVGDITKNVWLFGDSYFGYWMPEIYNKGIHNFLNNSQPGSSPEAAYTELQNLINLGYTPSYILWALGMNGNTVETEVNGTYEINTYQKTYIDKVKELCESKGIVPVFVAVPSTPSRQKTGFKAYIESLGCRYVNLYDALGSNEYGVWSKSPTLYAWKNEGTIVYTLKYDRALKSGDPIFDINGNATSKTISSVAGLNGNGFTSASTIVVAGKTYAYSSSDSVTGLLGNDSVHPSRPMGAKYIAQVFLNEFPEIALQ